MREFSTLISLRSNSVHTHELELKKIKIKSEISNYISSIKSGFIKEIDKK